MSSEPSSAKTAVFADANDRASWRVASIAAALAFVVFLPSLWTGFVFDDVLLISENPYAHDLKHIGRAFSTHLWDIYWGGPSGDPRRYYRPLVSVSYILNWVLTGGRPWTFHLLNVVVHAAATLLAVRVAVRWTRSLGLGLVAGLLFALHPTRSESVTWISGRTDVFMAFFMLLAVELAHRASTRPRAALGFSVGSVLAGAAAISSKEAGALVGLLVAVDWLLFERGSRARRIGAMIAITLFALGLLYVGGRAVFYPVAGDDKTLKPTPVYGLVTAWAYLERTLLPWPQTFFYRPLVNNEAQNPYPIGIALLGAALVIGSAAGLVAALRRDRSAALMLLVGLLLIAPVSNFLYSGIPVTTSDRFLYLPILPIACGVLRLFRAQAERLLEVRTALLALLGVGLASTAALCVRTLDYSDDETFWRAEHALNPDHPFVLGHIARLEARDGRLEEALAIVRRALAPEADRYVLLSTPEARTGIYLQGLGLLGALTPDGNVDKLEAIFHELDAFSRGKLSSMRGNVGDLAVGAPIPRRALAGLVAESRYVLFSEAAVVGARIGKDARARELLALVPDERIWLATNPLNIALTHARLGDFSGARHRLEQLQHAPSGISRPPSELLDGLQAKLARAEQHQRALDAQQPELHRALAMAELGAYLRALRALRPLYDRSPPNQGVSALYVQLLVAARLEREAFTQASRSLGPEQAKRAVSEIREQLAERVRAMPPVPEPSAWWPG